MMRGNVIHRCQTGRGKAKVTFFVREPTGREILETKLPKYRKDVALKVARDMFSRYLVHEDGTPLTNKEVNAFLDMPIDDIMNVVTAIMDKTGLDR